MTRMPSLCSMSGRKLGRLVAPLFLICWFASPVFATLSISSLSPTSGAIGASITISGSGFGSSQGGSAVKFNGVTATATSWKNTTIVAIVPSGATTGNVVVTVSGNSSNGVTFTVVPAPSISNLSPTSAAIGASITIAGSNFGSTQGSGTVKFNGTTATITSWNATSIVATVPSGATTGNVVVFASGVNSNGVTFTVVPAPSISALSPSSGIVGTPVTITGVNFGATQANGTVTFGGVPATVTSWSATSIQTRVPSTAGTGNVIVFASGVNSNTKTFTVTPQITNLWDNSAIIGAKIVIQGAGFGSTQGTVTFFSNKTATISAWGPNYITAIVPSGATTGNLAVTTGGATSNGVPFTVGTAPIISSISPNTSSPPQPVVITGSFFGALMQDSYVKFNGIAARPTFWSSTSIVTPVPYGVGGGGPVIVTVNNIASNSVTFTANYWGTISGKVTRSSDGAPVVGAQVQAVGVINPSTTTAADGSYSLAVSAEQLVGLPNNSPFDINVYVSGYLVTRRAGVLAAEDATTTVNLVVPVPTITKLSPAAGPIGSTVTIAGTNFGLNQGGSTVSFNGISATPTNWSNSSIIVSVPPSATTGPVVITQPTQSSNGMTFAVGVGALTGTVTNASNGTAITGATVQALQANTVQGSATSAADGTYTISNLSPGTYDVRISASGFGTLVLPANSVNVGTPTTVNGALSPPGGISGKVTKADGITAISGASVTALQSGETGSSATTDSSGNYTISALAAGTYVVQATATGFSLQTQTGVAVTANSNATVNLSLPGQSVITYAYDPAGRLVGVSDSASNTASYSYDLVGNLLAIATNPTSQTSVIGFDPVSGSSGIPVTISGTGFSSTIAQNSVSFNGTPATVTSATQTQLVATVPLGAATGPIAVTTPNGTASSASSFVIGGNANAPTISGFSPNIAASGTTLTINGTNFDTTAANDLTLINRLARSSITAATQASLATTVPTNATTGYISVTTPSGKATSSAYLFVPPSPYNNSQVVFAGALPFQTPTTVNFTAASQIALLAFDGTAGQRVVLYLSASSSSSVYAVTLRSPSGAQLQWPNTSVNGTYSSVTTLPATGTYTVLSVLTTAGSTNSLTTTLYNVPPDVTATMTVGGPSVPVNLPTVGQSAKISFAGTVGQRVSLVFSNNSPGFTPYVNIVGPDLNLFRNNRAGAAGPGLFTNAPITLPQSGTYTIILQTISIYLSGMTTGPGSVTLALYNVPADVTGTASVNGPALPVGITGFGQNATITFTGTSGQAVTVHLTNNTICQLFVELFDANGVNYLTQLYTCSSNFNLPQQTLSTTGTYTILIDPQDTATGSVSVSVTSP
jgi:YD repeat-containing protein